MKKKKFNKRLSLNKEIISNLNDVRGGSEENTDTCQSKLFEGVHTHCCISFGPLSCEVNCDLDTSRLC